MSSGILMKITGYQKEIKLPSNPKSSRVHLECCQEKELGKRPWKELSLPSLVLFPRPRISLFPKRLCGEELELNWDVEEFLLCAQEGEISEKLWGGKIRDGGMRLSSGQGNNPRKIQLFQLQIPLEAPSPAFFPLYTPGISGMA